MYSCYKLNTTKVTWQEARDTCVAEQADLLSIHNIVENSANFVYGSMQEREATWIGLKDFGVIFYLHFVQY